MKNLRSRSHSHLFPHTLSRFHLKHKQLYENGASVCVDDVSWAPSRDNFSCEIFGRNFIEISPRKVAYFPMEILKKQSLDVNRDIFVSFVWKLAVKFEKNWADSVIVLHIPAN